MKHPRPNRKPDTQRTHCRNGHEYTDENKHFYRKDKSFFTCKQCTLEAQKRVSEKLHHPLWTAYGNKCACCGETNREFFTIDHIFNDGSLDRGKFGKGKHIYRKLRDEGYPKDRYQILCFNCNMGRAKNGGICPHVSGGKH